MRGEPVRGGWPEPGFEALPGMERARALLRGFVPQPPLSHLLGLRLTQVGSGTATMTMPATPWLQFSTGRLCYGALLEAVSSVAVLTGAPPSTQVDMTAGSLNMFRPCTPESESLIGRARVLNSGPIFTHTEVLLEDAIGRLLAHATMAAVFRPLHPASPPPPRSERFPEPTYPTPDPYRRSLPDGVGVISREVLEGQDGLNLMRRVFFGDLPRPPLFELFGAHSVTVEAGKVRFEVPASEWLCTRRREIAAGVLGDVGGAAAWAAVTTTAPTGSHLGWSSANSTVLRPVEADGRPLVVEGWLADREGDVLLAAVTITDASGRRVLISHGTGLLQPSRRPAAVKPRAMVLTVLFTDLAASTRKAGELGDDRWGELLAQHHALVRHQLDVSKGREVKTTGDGFLATFENPADALECARRAREAMRGLHMDLRMDLRMGLHTGQCEVADGDVVGIAVHVASRVLGAAEPGEILVSGTLRDVLLGSNFKFEDRGRHELKGLDGDWALFALVD
jgi:class 3 adenylate cyclase